MKKLVLVCAVAIALVACNSEKKEVKNDSIVKADSIAKIDSIKKADSVKKADSIAKTVTTTTVTK